MPGYLDVEQESCHLSGHSRHILNVLFELQSTSSTSKHNLEILSGRQTL